MSTPTSATRLGLRALRTATLSLIFGVLAAVAGCGLISFDTTVDIAPSVVPGNPAAAAAAPAVVTTTEIPLDPKHLPRNADLARSAQPNSLTVQVTAPAGATL